MSPPVAPVSIFGFNRSPFSFQANRRYTYFSRQADIEGYNDIAAVFRSTAEGETGHALKHLEYLQEVGGGIRNVHVRARDVHERVCGKWYTSSRNRR